MSTNIKWGEIPSLREIVHNSRKKAIPKHCVQQAVEISYWLLFNEIQSLELINSLSYVK